MFNIKNDSIIYHVFDLEYNKYLKTYLSYEELIQFLAKHQDKNHHHSESKYGNEILDNLNLTLKDKKINCSCYSCKFKMRNYVIVDNYERIIDVRHYYKEILNQSNKKEKRCNNHNYFYYINRMRKKVGKGYKGVEFRRGPIPFISNGHSRGSGSAGVRTTNERRQGFEKEVQKYIRGKRMPMNLPTMYDDRHNDKCWKTQTKCKKQWMKNLK